MRPQQDQQTRTTEQRLAEDLLQEGIVSQKTLAQALRLRRIRNESLLETLYAMPDVRPADLAAVLSRVLRLPLATAQDLDSADPAAVALLDEQLARHYSVLPLALKGDTLTLAVGDPVNLRALEELRVHLRRRVETHVAPLQDVREAISLHYRNAHAFAEAGELSQGAQEQQVVQAEAVTETPIVRTVNRLLEQAYKDRASDIHIEAQRERVRVRYRIDGILHEVLSLPVATLSSLLSRIKVMAELNPAERRHPQDGQFTFQVDGTDVDVRVATAESVDGETMVLRLLNRRASFLTLPSLGLSEDTLVKYEPCLKRPFGMILVAGPTGSGKTTTLYGSLGQLDRDQTNIMTIEDPVEYRFSGITQLQVSKRYGITFATGLRALMRMDPDVILVGEVRDPETAQIAVQAALTGHLVLSSIHANDAASAIFRLLDLGADRFMVSASLVGVVAQRMVRRVCEHCGAPKEASQEDRLTFLQVAGEDRTEFMQGSGCSYCANTGYMGRTGIFELLEVNEAVQQLLFDGARAAQIREHAVRNGMTTMLRDGMRKAGRGVTTPSEVLRHAYSIT